MALHGSNSSNQQAYQPSARALTPLTSLFLHALPLQIHQGLLYVWPDASEGATAAAAAAPMPIIAELDQTAEWEPRTDWFMRDVPISMETVVENVRFSYTPCCSILRANCIGRILHQLAVFWFGVLDRLPAACLLLCPGECVCIWLGSRACQGCSQKQPSYNRAPVSSTAIKLTLQSH
jgi:hypothetical protein